MEQPLFESYLQALDARTKYEPSWRADKILKNERDRFEYAERLLAEYAASDDENAPKPDCPYSAGEISIILNEISSRMSPHAESI